MSEKKNQAATNSEVELNEISIEDILNKIQLIFKLLLSNWVKIIIIAILGGVVGIYYAWKQPITYNASLSFIVEEGKAGNSSLGSLSSLAVQFGVEMGGTTGGGLLSGDNLPLYFKSTSIIREVLLSEYEKGSKKTYADIYAENYKYKEDWIKNEKVGEINFSKLSPNQNISRLQDSLLKEIIGKILIKELNISKIDKKASLIEVSVTTRGEMFAKKFCEKIVSVAVEKYLNIKTSRQKQTVEKLQSRVDSISNLLAQKTSTGIGIQNSLTTMDINPLFRNSTMFQNETVVRDKSMLSALFGSITQNLEMAKFTLSQETPVIQLVDTPIFPLKKNKVSRLLSGIIVSFLSVTLFSCYIIFKNEKKKWQSKN